MQRQHRKVANATNASAEHEPRWRRRKDDRPREILNAALAVFLEKGFAATRLEDIAEKAKVTKGTLFIYFENKEELFRSLIRDAIAQSQKISEITHVEIQATAQDTIILFANNWWKYMANSDLGKIPKMIISEANNFPDLAKEYFDNCLLPGRQILVDAIRHGVKNGEFKDIDPEAAARIFLAPYMMSQIWRYSMGPIDSAPMDHLNYINTHLKMTMNGLLKQPS